MSDMVPRENDITLQGVQAHIQKFSEWQVGIDEWKDDNDEWRDAADKRIAGIERSIAELSATVATKEDMREIRQAISNNNENFSAALQSVPARLAASSLLVALFGAIAMAVAAIAAFYK